MSDKDMAKLYIQIFFRPNIKPQIQILVQEWVDL